MIVLTIVASLAHATTVNGLVRVTAIYAFLCHILHRFLTNLWLFYIKPSILNKCNGSRLTIFILSYKILDLVQTFHGNILIVIIFYIFNRFVFLIIYGMLHKIDL